MSAVGFSLFIPVIFENAWFVYCIDHCLSVSTIPTSDCSIIDANLNFSLSMAFFLECAKSSLCLPAQGPWFYSQ